MKSYYLYLARTRHRRDVGFFKTDAEAIEAARPIAEKLGGAGDYYSLICEDFLAVDQCEDGLRPTGKPIPNDRQVYRY